MHIELFRIKCRKIKANQSNDNKKSKQAEKAKWAHKNSK